MDDVFAQYYEDLLKLQYQVSEEIVQMLPRGTVREDFLKDIFLKRIESLRAKKGIVVNNGEQSGECDLIFYDHASPVSNIGELITISPQHTRLVLEVKSNATGTDLRKTNENFGVIKNLSEEHSPKCGLFCYNLDLSKKTVLNRFGYNWDKDIEGWLQVEGLSFDYPNVDFLVCIDCLNQDEEYNDETCKKIFLVKDQTSETFFNKEEYPVIKSLISVIDNL